MHTSPSSRRRRRLTPIIAGIGAIGLAGCATASASDEQPANRTVAYEVTENTLKVAFDPDIVFDDGMPAYGAPFVTQGYIYPAGTLTPQQDGILADGEPEFPDQVVGTWTCYGHMVGNGVRTEKGAWVVSTQLYDIDGVGTFVTTGNELIDLDTRIVRAVTGGTGGFRSATGVQSQTLNGFNELEGVMLDVELDLDDAVDHDDTEAS